MLWSRRTAALAFISLVFGGVFGRVMAQTHPNPPFHATPVQPLPQPDPNRSPGFSNGSNVAPALSSTDWTLIGPAPLTSGISFSGRITGVAADPSISTTLYIASASGGVWKTTDGGTNWTPLTDTQQTLAMGAIAVSPTNAGSIIYAGTGEANNSADSQYGRGILVSADAGATWTQRTGPAGIFSTNGLTTSKIVIHPTNPNIAYAAMGNVGNNLAFTSGTGVYKTIDNGSNWVNVTGANGKDINDSWSDVAIDPNTPSTLYAAVGTFYTTSGAGVYKSLDSGASWNLLASFPNGAGNVGRISIAISKTNSLVLYVSVAAVSTGGLFTVALSTDGGLSSNNISPPNYMGGQGWYDQWIAVDPTNAAIAYVGGSAGTNSVMRTINSGGLWTDIHTGGSSPHVDHHAVTFDALNRLIDGDDGGIFRLDNPSPVTWADLNGNLATNQFVGVAAHPTDANIALGGTQDNGTLRMTGGNIIWATVDGGDGGRVRFNQQTPANLLRVSPVGSFGTANFFRKSTNTGANWSAAVTGLNGNDAMNFYPPFTIDSTNGNHALFASDRVYETTNFATSWAVLGTTGLTLGTAIDAVAIAPSDAANTFYVAQGGYFASSSTFLVTTNHGTSWTVHNLPAGNGRIADIIVDAASASTVYVVVSNFDSNGHVFKSVNSGTTWSPIGTVGGGLPNLPTWTLRKDAGTGFLYVGDDNGVYRSTNDGTSWSRYGLGLPNVEVQDLDLNTGLGILTAGTYGRSNWQILLSVPAATNVTGQFTISNFAPSFNRITQTWTQTVTMTNNGSALSNVAYVLDSLNAGWTLTNGDGATVSTSPAGSPYKIIGAVGAGATSTFQLTFTRVGAPVFSYTPRVLEGTPR